MGRGHGEDSRERRPQVAVRAASSRNFESCVLLAAISLLQYSTAPNLPSRRVRELTSASRLSFKLQLTTISISSI